MDIEERAEKWAREYQADHNRGREILDNEDLIAAYLAGVAQTQGDYSADCSRCVCTCGAR